MFLYTSFLPIGTAVLINFQFDGDHYARFPVEFSLRESTETIPGFVELDFGSSTPSSEHPVASSPTIVTGYRPISDGMYYEDFGGNGRIPDFRNTVPVDAHPGSIFASGQFLIYPTSLTQGTLIIDPHHPEIYALDNQLYYSASSDNRLAWIVENMAIGFLDNDSTADVNPTDFVSCSISGVPTSRTPPTVPSHIYNRIRDMIESWGITVTERVWGAFLSQQLTDDQLDQLPTIQFILQSDTGTLVNIATLEPREYVSDQWPTLDLKLANWRDRNEDGCILTAKILKKLVVHFDTRNNRIGFGEPISEL